MGNNNVLISNFKVILNGIDLTGNLMSAIESLTFEDEINLPAMFNIKLSIADFEKGDWRGIDLKAFKPGDTVKVFMGMDSSVEMITGEITSIDVTFDEHSIVEVHGYDKLHRLRFGNKRRSFKDVKDSDIASTIASEIGLTPQVNDTEIIYPYVFQNNQTNYEFLLGRAKRINYEALVKDKTFIFRQSQDNKTPELSFQHNVNLQSFSVRLKTLTEGSEINVKGWDVKKKELFTSKASKGSESTKMNGKESGYELSEKAFNASSISVIDKAIIDLSDAEKVAKARYNSTLNNFITGEGTCTGNPEIRAGKTVEIKGLGDRFSGTYYVTSTVHSISNEGYKTTFKVRRTGV